jgi:predicted class III extradiol MEMO1 family dioxygenase
MLPDLMRRAKKILPCTIAVDDAEVMQDDAKALFKVLDNAPEAALMALH